MAHVFLDLVENVGYEWPSVVVRRREGTDTLFAGSPQVMLDIDGVDGAFCLTPEAAEEIASHLHAAALQARQDERRNRTEKEARTVREEQTTRKCLMCGAAASQPCTFIGDHPPDDPDDRLAGGRKGDERPIPHFYR
jgi:hypothetical protein